MTYELTRSSPVFHRVTTGPFNCLTYQNADGLATGGPCRRIRATGTGSVTVKRPDGTSEQLDIASDGEIHDVQCSEITSLSGVTAVTVYW